MNAYFVGGPFNGTEREVPDQVPDDVVVLLDDEVPGFYLGPPALRSFPRTGSYRRDADQPDGTPTYRWEGA